MFDIFDTATVFVKGFAQNEKYDKLINPSECHGEFIAIITDLVTSSPLKVKSATMDNGQWILECSDGETRVYGQEPNNARSIRNGQLVKNFKSALDYEVISSDQYDEAIKDMNNGIPHVLIGTVNGNWIRTSSLTKFWIGKDGTRHGITKSGSHYIF